MVQQLDQRVDVVALERLDVARQQRALLGVPDVGRPAGVELELVDRRPGALQRAVHAGDAHLEELRDLGGLPAHHLAEDERGALLRRQMLQRGDERESHRFLRHGGLLGTRVGRDERVGDRLDPGDLG